MRGWRSCQTSSWSTSTRRACFPTHDGSTAGSAATGRFCYGCFRSYRRSTGSSATRLPIIGRWKILDNLRRSLVAPTLLALLVAGWTLLPGPSWVLDDGGHRRCRRAAAAGDRASAHWAKPGAIHPGVPPEPASGRRHRAGAGFSQPDVPSVPRLRYRARHCRDARAPRDHQDAACWSGKRQPRRPRRLPASSDSGCADSSRKWPPAPSSRLRPRPQSWRASRPHFPPPHPFSFSGRSHRLSPIGSAYRSARESGPSATVNESSCAERLAAPGAISRPSLRKPMPGFLLTTTRRTATRRKSLTARRRPTSA